jgi:CRISPR-associated protein Csx17
VSTVALAGCQPAPLASYLKALAVLRLVAEQHDPEARGCWTPEGFELRSTLDGDALVEFFSERYAPTPIVAPWNGGSGFYAKDNQDGIGPIAASEAPRFLGYRVTIERCRAAIDRLGLEERPADEAKRRLLAELRATLPDFALSWLDAVIVISDQGTMFPPLLGTGGNDGRLEFTNNQMQHLAKLLLVVPPERRAALIRAALFDIPEAGMDRGGAGQFFPSSLGGANAGPGFEGQAVLNVWDFVLALEGTVSLAASATRRDEVADRATLVFPFTVRAAASGYGTAARSDVESSRNEIWLPLWESPATSAELLHLFGEGRAKVGLLAARTGVDFARAIASLGVSRGINAFERFGFHERNGLAFFAVPLGRWAVGRRRRVDLLAPIDWWLEGLRRAADNRLAPSSLGAAATAVDDAVMAMCRHDAPEPALMTLVALGGVERVASRSPKAREMLRRPLPALSCEWLEAAAVDDPEFRLAAALASTGFRRFLGPVDPQRPHEWVVGEVDQVWGERDLVRNLGEVLRRRALRDQTPPAKVFAPLGDIGAFIAGEVDDGRLNALLGGLSLLDWERHFGRSHFANVGSHCMPLASFAMLVIALRQVPDGYGRPQRTPGLLGRALAGDLRGATRLATRRLRAAGLHLRCSPLPAPAGQARRIAAALAFPISPSDESALRSLVTISSNEENVHDVP